jgi:hypothetical protein
VKLRRLHGDIQDCGDILEAFSFGNPGMLRQKLFQQLPQAWNIPLAIPQLKQLSDFFVLRMFTLPFPYDRRSFSVVCRRWR